MTARLPHKRRFSRTIETDLYDAAQYGAVSDVVGSFSPFTHHKEGCTMHNQNDFPGRRQFLGRLAAGAATMGLASLADPLTLAAETVSPLPDEKSFEEWLGRVKGKHKQGFGSMM